MDEKNEESSGFGNAESVHHVIIGFYLFNIVHSAQHILWFHGSLFPCLLAVFFLNMMPSYRLNTWDGSLSNPQERMRHPSPSNIIFAAYVFQFVDTKTLFEELLEWRFRWRCYLLNRVEPSQG